MTTSFSNRSNGNVGLQDYILCQNFKAKDTLCEYIFTNHHEDGLALSFGI